MFLLPLLLHFCYVPVTIDPEYENVDACKALAAVVSLAVPFVSEPETLMQLQQFVF